ncbi:hypothetical protein AR687_15630 [Flavobacteriaceae bacterium CRH]|nr:hypothetical protein AR687_15630 [Flavobacteriaceae bacterium CRH]
MHNITPEDRYKEAIRSKFEEERSGGYSNYLTNPSQASLRDLCWKIFKLNPTESDLKIYFDFFKFKFDPINENTSIGYTNKFKKLGSFLKGDKKPAKIDTVNFAAILVDFKPRPYNNFNKKVIVESKSEKDLINIINDPESAIEIQIEDDIEIISNTKDEIAKPEKISFKRSIFEILKENKVSILAAVMCLSIIAGYFIFFNKQCMQWSGDHFEKVDCDLKANGFITSSIEPFDEVKFELKKVNVCDTTNCFINGKSVIWYAKTDNGADFFNTHGIHPENGKALRPVTEYIRGKYKKKDCASK